MYAYLERDMVKRNLMLLKPLEKSFRKYTGYFFLRKQNSRIYSIEAIWRKRVLNVKGSYIYEGMKAGDVTCTYADTTKLEKDYGYSPKTSVEDGLDEMYLWFKSNINKFD